MKARQLLAVMLLHCRMLLALSAWELSGDFQPPLPSAPPSVASPVYFRDIGRLLTGFVPPAPRPATAWRVDRDIWLSPPLDKLTNGGLALPRQLAMAVVFRPDKENGTLLAVRGPNRRIQFGLSYSVSASRLTEPRRLEMRLWYSTESVSERSQRPLAVFVDVQPRFRLGVSSIAFYVYLDGDRLSYEFWCPGQPFWSGNPEYSQLLSNSGSGELHQIRFSFGSTLHLFSDGVGNYFRGDISRFVLASPLPDHARRQRLKCQPGLNSSLVLASRATGRDPPLPLSLPPDFSPSSVSSSGDRTPPIDWLPSDTSTTIDTGHVSTLATLATTAAAPALPTYLKGEKGEAGQQGIPGVCTDRCPGGSVGDKDSGLEMVQPTAWQPGAKGEPGPSGLKGEVGPVGPRGTMGPAGQKGDVGPVGPRGEMGPAGPRGEIGRPGSKGEMGPEGRQGDPGLRGSTGFSGQKGDRGLWGEKGQAGEPGPPGIPGQKGEPGPPGSPGEMVQVGGSAAFKGEKGDRGDVGTRGRTGPPRRSGPVGPVGPVGPEGPPAVKGAKGEPGAPCTCAETGRLPPPEQAHLPREVSIFGGVRVITSYEVLADVGHTLTEGALVYTKDRNILYLKTDFMRNTWTEILIGGRPINMAFPTTATTPTPTPPEPLKFRPLTVTGPKLRLVALPFKMHGDLKYKGAHSNLAADYACQEAAKAAGLGGSGGARAHFRAFLNGLYSNLEILVQAGQRSSIPVVNFYNQKLFNSYSDLLSRGVWNREVQLQDFGGRNISQWIEHRGVSEILAWRGLRHGDRGSPDCDGFFTRSLMKRGLATDLNSGKLLQSDRQIACDTPLVVLCIEARNSLA